MRVSIKYHTMSVSMGEIVKTAMLEHQKKVTKSEDRKLYSDEYKTNVNRIVDLMQKYGD